MEFSFDIDNPWFSGRADIKTYKINELLGTKLRALYQRSKGRDLFDLDYSRQNVDIDIDEIIKCFKAYMEFSVGKVPSQKEFLLNMEAKENDAAFEGDMEGLLRPEIQYDQKAAFHWLKETVIPQM
ncbi:MULTISPECIES: nucleotidyl transferase AbiEii/AbiGii toxin family protein [Flavobacteriaceae]|uniref:Nucleotidyl transferase AbiEii/AbiGii toxin family protein n=1 Tax=Autumnicola musiva TaxID=3075589 RepID=A0ABU3D3P8_9FLAO|nr:MULTISPECIES: nucleotidyl transferase AbiEii/AbiGii toxin family protein [Flavobacteriaceae]MDT0676147.1 nucleotidyl transferase AbiEii/AbiGii toxin family protein [Zunongwangia sp. F117]